MAAMDAHAIMMLGYADGPHAGRRVYIGLASASGRESKLATFSSANSDAVVLIAERYVVGRDAARLVVDQTKTILMALGGGVLGLMHLRGGWFAIDDGEAVPVVETAALDVGARLLTFDALGSRWAAGKKRAVAEMMGR